jgi:hypothetical protein
MAYDELTPRERQVLDLAERGLTNDAIALRLGISRNAVRYHLKELHSKLGTDSERPRLVGWRRLKALVPALPAISGAKLAIGTAMGAFAVAGSAAAFTLTGSGNEEPPALAAVDDGCPDHVTAWHDTTLEEFVAEYRGTLGTYEELAELNAELVSRLLPAGTAVRVVYDADTECGEAEMTPAGVGTARGGGTPATSQAEQAAEVSATPAGTLRHSAMPGDTPGSLAAEYGITVEALLDANPWLDMANLLPIGEVLTIPVR